MLPFWVKYSLRFRLRDMFSVTETPNPDCASVDPQAVQEHHDDPTTRPTTIQETTSTVRRLSPTEYWREARWSSIGNCNRALHGDMAARHRTLRTELNVGTRQCVPHCSGKKKNIHGDGGCGRNTSRNAMMTPVPHPRRNPGKRRWLCTARPWLPKPHPYR